MQTLSFPVTFSFKGFNPVAKLYAYFVREMALRHAERDLQRMSDRALADMGISRAEIKAAVRGRRLVK